MTLALTFRPLRPSPPSSLRSEASGNSNRAQRGGLDYPPFSLLESCTRTPGCGFPRLSLSPRVGSPRREPFVDSNTRLSSFDAVALQRRRRGSSVLVRSLSDDSTVYQGTYGPWKVETSDKLEVLAYRFALVSSALAFLFSSSVAFLPDDNQVKLSLISNLDFLYFTGAGSLGVALVLIHIYVSAIKRTLQALWAVGLLGSVWLELNYALPSGESLIQFAVHNNYAVWFVGPLFAALTGLVFKEGLCYGKPEAAVLFFIIPSLLLSHLFGVADENVEKALLGLWMLFFAVFASRKFTQPIKDDIGDKSVFVFQSLSPEEQASLIERLNSSNQ